MGGYNTVKSLPENINLPAAGQPVLGAQGDESCLNVTARRHMVFLDGDRAPVQRNDPGWFNDKSHFQVPFST
jgi:hypothetical protein